MSTLTDYELIHLYGGSYLHMFVSTVQHILFYVRIKYLMYRVFE